MSGSSSDTVERDEIQFISTVSKRLHEVCSNDDDDDTDEEPQNMTQNATSLRSRSLVSTTTTSGNRIRMRISAVPAASGSKKSKRRKKSKRSNYPPSQPQQQAEVTSVAKSDKSNYVHSENSTSTTNSPPNDLGDILPPRNTSAYDVKRVFNLKDIITREEMDELTQPAHFLKLCSLEEIGRYLEDRVYAKFTLLHLQKHQSKVTHEKAKLLAYYDYLHKFSKVSSRKLQKKPVSEHIPDIFTNCFMSKFTMLTYYGNTTNGRRKFIMTTEKRDKLHAYAMVVALFAENYSIDLTIFSYDFETSVSKCIQIAECIGCHVVSKDYEGSKTAVAQLKIPLFNPGR